ncbi:hypothetical protein C2845_PM14G08410 [Panicum miliaceum]|uniref:Uncharacterized protein n=1 Tax=Panicum miliaceum TaxID=4540 RepID=A0A3L6PNJ5_PANMI|nr:hypothetical protein C2845_PM14G08410 [Panicum miliaceum]
MRSRLGGAAAWSLAAQREGSAGGRRHTGGPTEQWRWGASAGRHAVRSSTAEPRSTFIFYLLVIIFV